MFTITYCSKKSAARLGRLRTPHGELETPFFMPDATKAAVKGLSYDDLQRVGVPALVINTYHLWLQPGSNYIKRAGGAHHFMHWSGSLASDSGGYQIFSLINRRKGLGKITDTAVTFRSPLDGSQHILTPEVSIKTQFALGADIIICLDDCPEYSAGEAAIKQSVTTTIAWARRCKASYEREIKRRRLADDKRPLLVAVVQGGMDTQLRRFCAQELHDIGFTAYGFGGRHLEADGIVRPDVLAVTAQATPQDCLRFGLGIGRPQDIVMAVQAGWDIFDCVIPTREGRHGRIFLAKNSKFSIFNLAYRQAGFQFSKSKTFYVTVNIQNAKFAKDNESINKESVLPELREYSKAYLHHLFKVGDPLALRLASLHNLEFYVTCMNALREAISLGKL